MFEIVKKLFLIGILFLIVDFTYLQIVSSSYATMIKDIQNTSMIIRLLPVVLCYTVMVAALFYFIIQKKESLTSAFILGFVIYAVFNTTNLALLSKWRWSNSILDSIWGGILFVIVTKLYYMINVNM
jgi:uncharacterized membrane protein